jgi:hypothetical protein
MCDRINARRKISDGEHGARITVRGLISWWGRTVAEPAVILPPLIFPAHPFFPRYTHFFIVERNMNDCKAKLSIPISCVKQYSTTALGT